MKKFNFIAKSMVREVIISPKDTEKICVSINQHENLYIYHI